MKGDQPLSYMYKSTVWSCQLNSKVIKWSVVQKTKYFREKLETPDFIFERSREFRGHLINGGVSVALITLAEEDLLSAIRQEDQRYLCVNISMILGRG